MKKYYLLLIFLCGWTGRPAAQDVPFSPAGSGRNIVKMNLASLALRNFSFQYERRIDDRFTLAGGFRFMPKGPVPLLEELKFFIGGEEVYEEWKDARLSNIAVTAEGRYYPGKLGAPRGFYLGPYIRFAHYQGDLPEYEYQITGPQGEEVRKTIPISGRLNKITAGILTGAQWKLGKRLYLDWWLMGIAAGPAGGKLRGEMSLSPEEQEAVRRELEDLDFRRMKTDVEVDDNGARADISGTFIDLRTGICLGFRF